MHRHLAHRFREYGRGRASGFTRRTARQMPMTPHGVTPQLAADRILFNQHLFVARAGHSAQRRGSRLQSARSRLRADASPIDIPPRAIFPAPDTPTMPTGSPGAIFTVTPSSTLRPAMTAVTARMSISTPPPQTLYSRVRISMRFKCSSSQPKAICNTSWSWATVLSPRTRSLRCCAAHPQLPLIHLLRRSS